jgi:hypothetical protein
MFSGLPSTADIGGRGWRFFLCANKRHQKEGPTGSPLANNIWGLELLLREALDCVDTEFGVLFSMRVSFRVTWRSKR